MGKEAYCFAVLHPDVPGNEVVKAIVDKWHDKHQVDEIGDVSLEWVNPKDWSDRDDVMFANKNLIWTSDYNVNLFLRHLDTAVEIVIGNGGNPTISLIQMGSFFAHDIELSDLKKAQAL